MGGLRVKTPEKHEDFCNLSHGTIDVQLHATTSISSLPNPD